MNREITWRNPSLWSSMSKNPTWFHIYGISVELEHFSCSKMEAEKCLHLCFPDSDTEALLFNLFPSPN